jgi:uroporphyrinogen-III synthase
MRMVAVLRPEPGASATLRRARELGLEPVALPLFELAPREWINPEDQFDGLLLTSANAVRLAGDRLACLRHLPVHAVGEATAQAARTAGLQVESVGALGVDALLADLPARLRLLHLCGEERREPASARQQVTAVTVYAAVPLPAPNLARLRGVVALVHSPRAGARLAELVADRSRISVAAISDAAAQAAGPGWERVAVAGRPDDAELLSLAARMCQLSFPE